MSGVRYEVLIPAVLWPELQALADATEEGTEPEVALHIHYSATANQPVPVLVGFLRRPERDFFRKFITVEGVGPAKAVKAMTVSVSTIARAIEREERAVLTKLPGIGTRAADKIIATLRGKVLAEAALLDAEVAQPVDLARAQLEHAAADAAEAIAALGYTRTEAKRWVEDALEAEPGLGTVEDLTLAVLRRRGARG